MPPIGIGIIKPLSVSRALTNTIVRDLVKRGYTFTDYLETKICMTTADALLMSETYKDLDPLIRYQHQHSLSSGRSVILALHHRDPLKNTINHWIQTVGNQFNTIQSLPGSLCAAYGGHTHRGANAPLWDNGFHGSITEKSAKYEYSLLFPS